MNEGKNNLNGKKKIGISEFIEKNHKLLTVFGVFLALTSYLTVTNHASVAISFILSVLVGLSVLGKFLNIKNISTGLVFFALFLFLLIFSIATFVSVKFEDIVTPIVAFSTIGLGAYVSIKIENWFENKCKNNTSKRIVIFGVNLIVLLLFSPYFGAINHFLELSLTEYKLSINFLSMPFAAGLILIVGYVAITNLYSFSEPLRKKLNIQWKLSS